MQVLMNSTMSQLSIVLTRSFRLDNLRTDSSSRVPARIQVLSVTDLVPHELQFILSWQRPKNFTCPWPHGVLIYLLPFLIFYRSCASLRQAGRVFALPSLSVQGRAISRQTCIVWSSPPQPCKASEQCARDQEYSCCHVEHLLSVTLSAYPIHREKN
jgi:hypothetical protein